MSRVAGGWLFAAAWLVFVILKVAGVRLQSLRQRRSRSWPWAKTTIEGGSVELVSQEHNRVYRLTASYSYSVNGETYGGAYTECFRSDRSPRRAEEFAGIAAAREIQTRRSVWVRNGPLPRRRSGASGRLMPHYRIKVAFVYATRNPLRS
jgi:hypothetical protein